MWIRGSGALALSLLLLLGSMVGLAGHDHATGVELRATECALDHEDEQATRTHHSNPTLEAGGERHHHHCLGCRHGGNRSFLTAPPPTTTGLDPGTEGLAASFSRPRVSPPSSHAAPRGPPIT